MQLHKYIALQLVQTVGPLNKLLHNGHHTEFL
jgi:hypothetical protein